MFFGTFFLKRQVPGNSTKCNSFSLSFYSHFSHCYADLIVVSLFLLLYLKGVDVKEDVSSVFSPSEIIYRLVLSYLLTSIIVLFIAVSVIKLKK